MIPPVCPLAVTSYYNSQASTYRADYNMSGQDSSTNDTPATSQGIASVTDIPGQPTEDSSVIAQELAKLQARIKTLEEEA